MIKKGSVTELSVADLKRAAKSGTIGNINKSY